MKGWLAHCLDLDVITYGKSLDHAMEMAREAITMVVDDDLVVGRDPLSRRAPKSCWVSLDRILRAGESVRLAPGRCACDEDQLEALAIRLHVVPTAAAATLWTQPSVLLAAG